MKKLFLAFALLTLIGAASCSRRTDVKSPDGRIEVFFTNDGDHPQYAVNVDGRELILPSALGIVSDQWKFDSRKARISAEFSQKDTIWNQPWGENKVVRENYREMAVNMADSASMLTVRFRVFDDGMAFRYEWKVDGVDTIAVTDELTEFNFAANGTSWSIPGNFETYELEYRNLALTDVEDANTPFTFRTETGVYGSIHEAALYDYPEMTLKRSAQGGLKADLAPLPDGVKAYVGSQFVTPWRTIQIGKSAVDLINSNLIVNLNEPSRIKDTSWIKPQKYVGIWWGMHLGTQTWTVGPRHGAITANAIKYIDFAKANNLQGVLFEGWNKGWENWGGNQSFDYVGAAPDFDIDSVASYARANGIELWAHNETGGNIPEYEAAMDSAFAYYASLGIHTVKTGYAGGFKGGYLHHSQYGVRHYQKVVETAARYRLMIDAHEPIKETGIRRTWPNMMTREGARGMEWNAWSAGNSADYLCTLPYVRLLSGPMDYTPGIFDIDYSRAKADKGRLEWNGPNADCCIKTTLARQIANWVIIYSPLQMAADLIENYEGHDAFEFFRTFNADCDWSEALQGEIGEYIAVARRAGDTFYVGAGTNSQPREIDLPLGFLTPDRKYLATSYADIPGSANPEDIKIATDTVTSADVLKIKMNATGGYALTLQPLE